MGIERKRGGRKDRGKIFEMFIESRCEDAGVSNKRGAAKREDEGKDGGRDERRLEEGRSSRLARMCWEEIREKNSKGGEISGWE